MTRYGMHSACGACEQDIEFTDGWRDRGGNRQCCTFTDLIAGRTITPRGMHDPAPAVVLRRTHDVEVGTGKPGYRWVTGWTYTTPARGEACALRLHDARSMAQRAFPGYRIVLEA